MSGPRHRLYLIAPGPRPPYYSVAEHLWGKGCNIDSDGDSDTPQSTSWTELTVILRIGGEGEPRVDVDPVGLDPLVLKVESDDPDLGKRAAEFLRSECGGFLSSSRP